MNEVNASFGSAESWHLELKLAKKEDDKWAKRAKKIIKRYRDERSEASNSKRYNILWSNIQTMLPALYGRTPRAQVERRYKDADPVGRTAATILERALQYEIDHYGEFDNAIKHAVLDRLLVGRGTAWVRFEMHEVAVPEAKEPQDGMMPESQELPEKEYECTPTEYVYWDDFRCSPARIWDEVTWVARRVYMPRDDLIARFGEEAKAVPMTHEPLGLEELKNQGASLGETDAMKKAQVWEIWDKLSKTVTWVAEGYEKILDKKEDPYGLDDFFPCPKPLFSTQTTDTLVPVPDYALYQDQAEEIDKLTGRISRLIDAVKVVGVYDSTQTGVQRLLNEGVENVMIPVDSWAAFSEKGGLKGTMMFLPLDQVLLALRECYASREQAKQVIYEVTGLSDIIRGSSNANETATAQQIKSQYGSLRLKRLQNDVAHFASDILRIKSQLMGDMYSPQTLAEMSDIMQTKDAQYAEPALQLISTETARNFRIEVASDSLVEMDEQSEKASRTEFMTAFGSVLRDALPMVQAKPELGVLVGEVLTFVVRTFKGGRQLENSLEATIAKMTEPKPPVEPPPDPEMMKMQAAQQTEQSRMQFEQEKLQGMGELEQMKLQQAQQNEQFKADQAIQLEEMRQQFALQIEQMKQDAETDRQLRKAEMDNATKLEIANIGSQTSMSTAKMSQGVAEEKLDDKGNAIPPEPTAIDRLADMHGELMHGVTGLIVHLSKPKVGTLSNGKQIRIEMAGD